MGETATIEVPKADTRIGDWMITYTGRRFYPLDPRPEDVDFRDIAHALSMICRYGGHVRRFYSVCEHSTNMCMHFLRQGKPRQAGGALLHDSPEAYVGDIIRPLKPSLDGFPAIEGAVAEAIFDRVRLDLTPEEWEEVKEADNRIIADEARELFGEYKMRAVGWWSDIEPLGVPIRCLYPENAERVFLEMFNVLFGDPRR